MTEMTWKRRGKNKIVAHGSLGNILLQLTRYKTSRVQPKGTWKLRVLDDLGLPSKAAIRTVLTVPIPETCPERAVEAAEAYVIAAQGLKEGPLARAKPLTFTGPTDRFRVIYSQAQGRTHRSGDHHADNEWQREVLCQKGR